MSNARLYTFVVTFIIVTTLATIIGAVIPTPADDATYIVITENGKTYYTNEFRIWGKGIVFTDVYKQTVIIQGDLEIVKKPEKNEK
jgi:hypothetical protein